MSAYRANSPLASRILPKRHSPNGRPKRSPRASSTKQPKRLPGQAGCLHVRSIEMRFARCNLQPVALVCLAGRMSHLCRWASFCKPRTESSERIFAIKQVDVRLFLSLARSPVGRSVGRSFGWLAGGLALQVSAATEQSLVEARTRSAAQLEDT